MNKHNPYESPCVVEPPLTPQQRNAVASLVAFRQHRSALRLLLSQWRLVSLYILLAGAVILPTILLPLPPGFCVLASVFALGMFSAAMGSLTGNCIARRRIWPVLERIIDWDKAHELLR
jgi:hypothetical protein